MLKAFLCPYLAFLTALAYGQATPAGDPIQTSRPDFTTSPQIVPLGSLQLELGASRYGRAGGSPDYWQFGEATLRYGLRPKTELRVDFPNYILSLPRSAPDGFDNTTISLPTYLGQIGGVDFGIMPGVIVPTGHPDLRNEEAAATFALLLRRDLGAGSDISSTLKSDFLREGGRRTEATSATLSYSRPLSGPLSAFLEYAGFYDRLSLPQNYAHLGLMLARGKNAQFDLHAGLGMSGREAGFVGAGYSVRL